MGSQRQLRSRVFTAGATLTVCALFFVACSGKQKGAKAPEPFTGCPETLAEVARLDWNLGEDARPAIMTGLVGSIAFDSTLGVLEEELVDRCGALARALGSSEKDLEPPEYYLGARANHTCAVAGEALGMLKDRSGGRVAVSLNAVLCATPMDAATKCLSACGGQVEPNCSGELEGRCNGICTGKCTDETAGECAGTCGGICAGSCDSEFEGVCRGACAGTCNGSPSKDHCDGTCSGRCMDGARGTCGGTCNGSCQGPCTIEAAGVCTGVCSGQCDQNLGDPSCVGPIGLPSDATVCQSSCDGALIAASTCTRPVVSVRVEGATNEDDARRVQQALSQHLPALLQTVAFNLDAERIERLSAQSAEAVETMKKFIDSHTLELESSSMSCLAEKAQRHEIAQSGLGPLLGAIDRAHDFAASEL